MCVCVYIYIYIVIYVHMHTHPHIHAHLYTDECMYNLREIKLWLGAFFSSYHIWRNIKNYRLNFKRNTQWLNGRNYSVQEATVKLTYLFTSFCLHLMFWHDFMWLGNLSVATNMWQSHTMPRPVLHFVITGCVLCDADNGKHEQLFH